MSPCQGGIFANSMVDRDRCRHNQRAGDSRFSVVLCLPFWSFQHRVAAARGCTGLFPYRSSRRWARVYLAVRGSTLIRHPMILSHDPPEGGGCRRTGLDEVRLLRRSKIGEQEIVWYVVGSGIYVASKDGAVLLSRGMDRTVVAKSSTRYAVSVALCRTSYPYSRLHS